jgi:hypothetical protein
MVSVLEILGVASPPSLSSTTIQCEGGMHAWKWDGAVLAWVNSRRENLVDYPVLSVRIPPTPVSPLALPDLYSDRTYHHMPVDLNCAPIVRCTSTRAYCPYCLKVLGVID